MILLIKFILALCSIAYELLLAQSMTAFLENTVLRYSVTIGFYLFAMGIGSLFIDRRMDRPWRTLWWTEVALSIVGALSVPSLFLVDFLSGSRLLVLLWGHGLILLIGFLTGFELPLILKILAKDGLKASHRAIAVDYAGALMGSLVFVFVLYPVLGIVASVLWVAFLNIIAGGLILKASSSTEHLSLRMWILQVGLVLVMVIALLALPGWERFLTSLYLQG